MSSALVGYRARRKVKNSQVINKDGQGLHFQRIGEVLSLPSNPRGSPLTFQPGDLGRASERLPFQGAGRALSQPSPTLFHRWPWQGVVCTCIVSDVTGSGRQVPPASAPERGPQRAETCALSCPELSLSLVHGGAEPPASPFTTAACEKCKGPEAEVRECSHCKSSLAIWETAFRNPFPGCHLQCRAGLLGRGAQLCSPCSL